MAKTKTESTGDLFPAKKKKTKGKDIYNIRAIKEKKFVGVLNTDKAKNHTKTEFFNKILGDMEGRCTICIYGRSGSGKSVLTLQLCEYLSQVYGKAIYDSHEERVNKSLKLRLENFNITSTTMWVTDSNTTDQLRERIEKMYIRVVVIDSVQYARLTIEKFKELREYFAKRNIIWILVSFGTVEGKTRDADKLLHASDIKIYVHKGQAIITNRYLAGRTVVQLFDPNLSVEIENDDDLIVLPPEDDLFTIPNGNPDENQS